MTLKMESPYILAEGEGEALWFSGGLLTYKTTGDQTGRRLGAWVRTGERSRFEAR